MKDLNLSRRSFLAATAMAGITAAVDASPTGSLVEAKASELGDKPGEETVVQTLCRACISNCGVLATVRDGRVVKLEGDPRDPMSNGRLCPKGLAGIQALYNPNRLKYPMKRVGERGVNSWERISWQEAIDTIADKLMDVYEQDPMTLVFSSGGGGNPQFYSPMRFLQAFGGGNFFEPGCAQCYLPRNHAQPTINGLGDNSIADSGACEIYYEKNQTKTLVLWGTDPSQSCPANGGRALANMRANGTKTVVVDPRFTPDAAKADVWLPVRPGTDVALMLAWIRYILDNDEYDHDFCLKWTNLPFLINPETRYCYRANELGFTVMDTDGTTDISATTYVVWDNNTNQPQPLPYPWDDALDPVLDGEFEWEGTAGIKTGYRCLWEACQDWTLDKAAETCDLQADKIEEAIRLYLDGTPHAGVVLGVATDQYEQSAQAAEGATILDVITGNLENPGNISQFRNAQNPGTYVVPAYDKYDPTHPLAPTEEVINRRLGFIEHKGLGFWKASHIPTIREALETGEPYMPRVWIDRSGNKPVVVGGANQFIEACKNFEFIVHAYMYPTAMSVELADIILPAAEWLEMSYVCDRLNVFCIRQRVTQLFECTDETLMWNWILKALADRGHEKAALSFSPDMDDAKRLGVNWLTYDDYEEYLASVVSRSFTEQYPDGLTWADCKEKLPMSFKDTQTWYESSYGHYLQTNEKTGKPYGFQRTTSLKCEPYAEGMIRLGRTGHVSGKYNGFVLPPASVDYEPLPYYTEPAESPRVDDEYPYTLTEGRVPFYHHGTLRNVPYLREAYPVARAWLNPLTADEIGVVDGDWVKLTSRRGETHGKVLVTEGIAPGVVYQERFWNPELLDSDDPRQAWQAMNINVLTKNDAPFNPEYGTYTLRGVQVKIEKSERPDGIWEDPKEFAPWMPEPSDNTGGGDAVYDA